MIMREKEGVFDLGKSVVLLVEDDPIAQTLFKYALPKIWIKDFDLAENGRQAVKKAMSKLYDIIIMDIRLPDMDWVEATWHIRNLEDGDYPKIIAYTALNSFVADEKFDWQIFKPASIKVLSDAIFAALKKTESVIL